MRSLFLVIALAAAMLSGCSRPTSGSDTDQQQGNPRAQPEKSATSKSNLEPDGNKAGKDAHTLTPSGAKKQ